MVDSAREENQTPLRKEIRRPGAGGPRPKAAPFSWEHAVVLTVAAVIGVYAGIAAGLFSQSIRFTQLVLFRSAELWQALTAPGADWPRLFERLFR